MSIVPERGCGIVVTRTLPGALMDLLRRSRPCWINPEERTLTADEIMLQAQALGAEALLVMAIDRIDARLIGALPDCVRVIATYCGPRPH